jgi:hypothetical protein
MPVVISLVTRPELGRSLPKCFFFALLFGRDTEMKKESKCELYVWHVVW